MKDHQNPGWFPHRSCPAWLPPRAIGRNHRETIGKSVHDLPIDEIPPLPGRNLPSARSPKTKEQFAPDRVTGPGAGRQHGQYA